MTSSVTTGFWSTLAFSLFAGSTLVPGCSGRAALSLVFTDQGRISRNEPFVVELHAAECCYWIDGERISIALADESFALTEYGKKRLVASIVLDGLPAHQSRDYRLNRNSIRGKVRNGPQHVRFASLSGILALWLEEGGRIQGRLRALAKRQHFHVMLGWTGNRQVLLVGDFVAVPNRERTEELLRRSEADGLGRSAKIGTYGRPRAVTGPPVRPSKAGRDDQPPPDRS